MTDMAVVMPLTTMNLTAVYMEPGVPAMWLGLIATGAVDVAPTTAVIHTGRRRLHIQCRPFHPVAVATIDRASNEMVTRQEFQW